jgi:hypothetical protein
MPLLRQTGCVCANRPLFQHFLTNWSAKNVGTIHFLFGGRFGVSQTERRRLAQYLANVSIKLKCANRKTDYYTTQSAKEVGGLEVFLCQADQNFEH